MPPESPPDSSSYSGKDVLYREGAVGFFDVQRGADALLRQGRKPSVGAIREHLGGGSPNTIAPLLAKYWQKLGERLAEGPAALEQVPGALARVTELMWRRALEEARERQALAEPGSQAPAVGRAAGADRDALCGAGRGESQGSEHLAQLQNLSRDRREARGEISRLLALLKGTQALLGKPVSSMRVMGPSLASRRRKSTKK